MLHGDSVWCYSGNEIRSIYSKFIELDECSELLALSHQTDSLQRVQIKSLHAVITDMERSSDMKDQLVALHLVQRDRANKEVKRIKRKSTVIVTLTILTSIGVLFISH